MCLQVSFEKNMKIFFFCILKVTEERSRIRSQWFGSADPHQNVTDPKHCSPPLLWETCTGTYYVRQSIKTHIIKEEKMQFCYEKGEGFLLRF
jgi:hypothetical protein